jgi:ABC-2 type transport system ATP-binding protein
LEVAQGDFFGLLGTNGAGKSTTIGIISSLVNKTAGTVNVLGYDLDKTPDKVKAQIGLVPQEFNFNIFERVIDVLIQQAGYYGIPYTQAKARAIYYLKKLNMLDKAKEPVRNLSGGLKRRLLIIRGILHEPKLLILDEPTAGVDIELRRSTWSFLQEINAQGTTIILTTHYLEEAESLCKRIAIINHGEIIQDMKVKQLLALLDKETIVLDLRAPLTTLPTIEGFEFTQVDKLTLEVSFHRKTTINSLFIGLTNDGCEILSMRNKVNRLEELFLALVKSNQESRV